MPIFSNLDYKKILLVAGFVVICLALIFLMYWLFFRATPPGPGEPGYVPPGGVLPDTKEGGQPGVIEPGSGLPSAGDIEEDETKDSGPSEVARGDDTLVLPITQNRVLNPTLSANKQGINYWDKEDQLFYRISPDGQSRLPLSDEKFFGVEKVTWSEDSTQAIITYPDELNVFYDFSTKEKTTLPKEVVGASFNSSGKEIAFKFVTADPNSNFIAVSSPNGSGAELIEPIGAEADKVQVVISPTEEVVALYAKPTSLDSSEIFFIGRSGENFKSLNVEGMHIKGLWSPSGNRLLYHSVSASHDYKPNLWIVDARGDNIGNHHFDLNLETWVDKCIFSSETELYCAVPKNLPEGSGLYADEITGYSDEIYKIDLTTGRKELIASPVLDQAGGSQFRMTNLEISEDGHFLFFWDQITEKVYSMRLR